MHPRFFSLYTRGRLAQLQCVPQLFWLGDTAIRCSDPLTWPFGIADACGIPSVFHARGHHRASCFLTPPSPSLHFHSFLVSRRTAPRGHTMGDHRLVVGATVHEKVRHLRSALTCALLLGSRADYAMPSGIVTAVMRSKVNGRTSTMTSGPFECVGTTVVKTLGRRTIRSGTAPALAPSTPPSISPPDATAAQQTTMTLSPPPPTDAARDSSRDPIARATGLSSTAFPVLVVGGPVAGHSDFGGEHPLLLHFARSLSAPRAPPIGTHVTPPSAQDTIGEPLTTVAGPPASGLIIPRGAASTTAHGLEWHDHPVVQPVGGAVLRTPWYVREPGRRHYQRRGGRGRLRSDEDTSRLLHGGFSPRAAEVVYGDEFGHFGAAAPTPYLCGRNTKVFGILILATRFQLGSRADLWATAPRSKHMPAPAFGARTGMSRHRLDTLWSALRSSQQRTGVTSTDDARGERYRWALINDFFCSINDHRAAHMTPGDTICADESMVKWYGLGGALSSLGLPRYVSKDNEPKNGYEIQNAACGRSGVMLRLHLVTTSTDQNAHLSADKCRLLLGTTDLHLLVGPWARTGRIVCADSYFSSTEAALSLKAAGLRFWCGQDGSPFVSRWPLSPLASLESAGIGSRWYTSVRRGRQS